MRCHAAPVNTNVPGVPGLSAFVLPNQTIWLRASSNAIASDMCAGVPTPGDGIVHCVPSKVSVASLLLLDENGIAATPP